MCRLMMFNHNFLKHTTEKELAGLFDTLDQKLGGHGMGIALCYDKNVPVVYKGVEETSENLAQLIWSEKDSPDLKYVIFHTRLSSGAVINDTNCHPFTEDTNLGLTMAHNGIIRQLSGSNDYCDTSIAFDLITSYGFPLSTLKDYAGVFVGVYRKYPFVYKASGYSDLTLCYTPDLTAWCFVSSLYQYTPAFKERFIIHSNLSTFSWSKQLTDESIDDMIGWKKKYNYYDNYNKVVQADTYRRNAKTAYHAHDCRDWYNCDGSCLNNSGIKQ